MRQDSSQVQFLRRRFSWCCAVCRSPLGHRRLRCARCETSHHPECWEYNGGCAVYGCIAVIHAIRPLPGESGSRREWWSTAILFLLVIVFVVLFCLPPSGAYLTKSGDRGFVTMEGAQEGGSTGRLPSIETGHKEEDLRPVS